MSEPWMLDRPRQLRGYQRSSHNAPQWSKVAFLFFCNPDTIEDLVFHNPRDCGSIVDNLQSKYNWDRLTSIAFRFCLLAHRPPQSLKLQRHQGKHDGDCRPLQKRQRVDGPLVLVPKMQRQSAYSNAMPSAFCLRPVACGLQPAAYGLLPSASLIKMCWANRAIHK